MESGSLVEDGTVDGRSKVVRRPQSSRYASESASRGGQLRGTAVRDLQVDLLCREETERERDRESMEKRG